MTVSIPMTPMPSNLTMYQAPNAQGEPGYMATLPGVMPFWIAEADALNMADEIQQHSASFKAQQSDQGAVYSSSGGDTSAGSTQSSDQLASAGSASSSR